MKRVRYLGVVILLSLSWWILGSFLSGITFGASEDFPKKEITIIVSYGPGGGVDILARGVAKTMSKYLGAPVVVLNVPGAGGARGITNLYHSAPDGYTLGVGTATYLILQVTEKQDYDTKKFTYIGNAQHSPGFMWVKSDSPFHSLKDFKTFGKSIRQSVWSLASNSTVGSMVLAEREGFPLVIVGGYQSAAAALLGLIRGEVEACSPMESVALPFVRSGQIRPILVIDQKRSPAFPDVLTVGEVGHPDLAVFANDFWLIGPPGVPKARVQILEDALMKALKDQEFIGWAKGAGVDPGPMSAQDTTKSVFDLMVLLEKYKEIIIKYKEK